MPLNEDIKPTALAFLNKPHSIREPLRVQDVDDNFDKLFKGVNQLLQEQTVLPPFRGGTGLTSFHRGDLLVATGPGTIARLPDVATGNALISGGIDELPSYGKINLTAGFHVSGDLPFANIVQIADQRILGNVSGGTADIAALTAAQVKTFLGTSGYAIGVQAHEFDPIDAEVLYFGMLPVEPSTTAANNKVHIRTAGTLRIANIYSYSQVAGSNESWTIAVRLNNTTDTTIATVAAATNERIFSNTGLSIAVVAGDYVEIKSTNPTWATNPEMTTFGGYIYIE
jgi:hypothetical protein